MYPLSERNSQQASPIHLILWQAYFRDWVCLSSVLISDTEGEDFRAAFASCRERDIFLPGLGLWWGVKGRLPPGTACFIPCLFVSPQLWTKCRTRLVWFTLPSAQVGDRASGADGAEGSKNPDLKPLFDSRPSVSNSRPFIAGKTIARPAGHATQPHRAQLMSTELITKLGFLASCPW